MLKVHFRGPVLTLSGYGVASRQLFDWMLEDGRFEMNLESINWGSTPYIHNHPRQMQYYECIHKFQASSKQEDAKYDISVHYTIPNEFKRTAGFNILCTAGIEVDRITKEWIMKCNEADIIVVPSEFSKEVMEGTAYHWKNKDTGETGDLKIQKPIVVVPHWFEESDDVEPLALENVETDTNFLFVGLWGTKGGFGEDRKNIADLVRLFYEAFGNRRDSVGLILKTSIVNNSPEDKKQLAIRIEQIKNNFQSLKNKNCKLYVVHDSLTDEQMRGLYRSPKVDCFVSLTHGEGFGLPTLEAHAAGLPVIATDWSGHMDFLRKGKGFLPIDSTLIEIPECQVWEGIIDKGSQWAKVDDKAAVKLLRKFAKNKKKFKRGGAANAQWVADNFSKASVSKKWEEFFGKFISAPQTAPSEQTAPKAHARPVEPQKQSAINHLMDMVDPEDEERVLFVMPRSAGDTLISTAVIDSLIMHRHFDTPFYFASSDEYKDILKGLEAKYENFHVISFDELMMNVEIVSEVWDYVYNPTVNVQYTFSNWLLGNGEHSLRLIEEFAKQCNLHPGQMTNYVVHKEPCEAPEGPYITFSPAGSKTAKEYKYWDDVLINASKMLPGAKIVQTGLASERMYDNVLDFRGKSYAETASLLEGAVCHIGVDTFTAHLAAALDIPHLIVYGSTSARTVSPVVLSQKKKKRFNYLIETADRHDCKNPCFKDSCSNLKKGRNCLSEISAEAICNTLMVMVEKINEAKEKEQDEVEETEERLYSNQEAR